MGAFQLEALWVLHWHNSASPEASPCQYCRHLCFGRDLPSLALPSPSKCQKMVPYPPPCQAYQCSSIQEGIFLRRARISVQSENGQDTNRGILHLGPLRSFGMLLVHAPACDMCSKAWKLSKVVLSSQCPQPGTFLFQPQPPFRFHNRKPNRGICSLL